MDVQQQPLGFIQRRSRPMFVVIFVLTAIVAGAASFVLSAVVAMALKLGPNAEASGVLSGTLAGTIVWIIQLRRLRRSGTPRKQRQRNEPAFGPGPQRPWPAEPSAQDSRAPAPEWFYADSGRRKGPLSKAELIELLQSGKLSPRTTVWRAGLDDWLPIRQSELSAYAGADTPPPLAANDVANGYAWALALAPLWATALHYVLASFYVAATVGPAGAWLAPLQVAIIVEKTWPFEVVVNILMAALDKHALKTAGWKSDRLNGWLVILVPIYLYQRDHLLGAGLTRFFVWIASFVLSLLPIW